jgi:hypothetical protein
MFYMGPEAQKRPQHIRGAGCLSGRSGSLRRGGSAPKPAKAMMIRGPDGLAALVAGGILIILFLAVSVLTGAI